MDRRLSKGPVANNVVANVSQHSAESARLSIEQQLKNLETERTILITRKREIENLIGDWNAKHTRITNGPEKLQKKELIRELYDIQARLSQIKPTKRALYEKIHRNDAIILEEILKVLKEIQKTLTPTGDKE